MLIRLVFDERCSWQEFRIVLRDIRFPIVTPPNSIVLCKLDRDVERERERGRFSFISPCITSVFSAYDFQTVSIANDLLSDSVKRTLLSVKGSHKFETERQKQTPCTVNQAFCQLARGVRLLLLFSPCAF